MIKKKGKLAAALSTLVLVCLMAGTAVSATTPANLNSVTQPQAVNCAASIGTWSLTISGVTGVSTFTSSDAAKLTVYEFSATSTNSKGVTSTSKYTGVKFKDVLSYLGITDFTTVTTTSADNYSTSYSKADAIADTTLLAWAKDDATVAYSSSGYSGPTACIFFAPTSATTSNMFSKYITTLTLAGATVSVASSSAPKTAASSDITATVSSSSTPTASSPDTSDPQNIAVIIATGVICLAGVAYLSTRKLKKE